MLFHSTSLALLGALFFAADAKEPTVRGRRRVLDADVQKFGHLHRNRHLTASDTECPRDPYAVDVSASLGTAPVIDGDGGDDAWAEATRMELFKASRDDKETLGFAYVMYDCQSASWFVKTDLLFPAEPGFCTGGQGCDHFVKVDGKMAANPADHGKYYENGMGWELQIPADKAPAADGSTLNIQVHTNVFEDNESQTAGTDNKSNCGLLKASCDGQVVAAPTIATNPVQTYYIPLPEESLFNDCFEIINEAKAKAPVESLISISVSTDHTVIWYDHWEFGDDEKMYDNDSSTYAGTGTEVWGDGNPANGCAPHVTTCSESTDKLLAGDVIVIQNTVVFDRTVDPNQPVYDGGDKIMASEPIAVTRGAYPEEPGSLMAGAVEVLPTSMWGTTFEAPIGTNVGSTLPAFEYSAFFYMAKEDQTVVTLPSGQKKTLSEGEGSFISVEMGDQITSTKPLQVDFITGDKVSNYELRWYSLLSVDQYSTSYVSPVGDSVGKTKVLLYNPGASAIDVTVEYNAKTFRCKYVYVYRKYNNKWYKIRRVQCDITHSERRTDTKHVESKNYQLSAVVPTASGAWIDSDSPFLALSLTDTEYYTQLGQATGGQWYDWGFPVVPRDQLTSQVIIGLGYGCTNNNCGGQTTRSVVWLSPVKDADVYIDYTNSGNPATKLTVKELASVKITDPNDSDMSGASIFATEEGTGVSGPSVDIAAAWGQDPLVSRDTQSISLDLGTVVLPMTAVDVSKVADKTSVAPGQTLTYTVTVSNVGHKNLGANELVLKDTLDSDVSYVAGSLRYSSSISAIGSGNIEDNNEFILESGYPIPFALPRRGGKVLISFKVMVSQTTSKKKLLNTGIVQGPEGQFPYETETKVRYSGKVEIKNQVYLGHDGGVKCDTIEAAEYVENYFGTDVTYCFTVTNTGRSHLGEIEIVNKDTVYTKKLGQLLAPKEKVTVFQEKTLSKAFENNAKVTANPTFANGEDIDTLPLVTDEDPSAVGLAPVNADIILTNTVYGGYDGGAKCGTDAAVESWTGLQGTEVTFCFTFTNMGNTHLAFLKLDHVGLQKKAENFRGLTLAPMETKTVSFESTITGSVVNWARIIGLPITSGGKRVPDARGKNLSYVKATDPSQVVQLKFNPSIEIQDTVYLGKDDGKKCGTEEAVEYVTDYYGADVTYCFKVINTGDSYLTDIEINNAQLDFKDSSMGMLAPGSSAFISHEAQITGTLRNVAKVSANPVTQDGTDIPNTPYVTHQDPSSVARKAHEPSIDIDNLVIYGKRGVKKCGTNLAKESVEGFKNDWVTYCFTVENTGSSHLADVVVKNAELDIEIPVGHLAPDVSKTVRYLAKIDGDLINNAVAVGNPVTEDLIDLPGVGDVTATDPSEVLERAFEASIEIYNTVYLGDDNGNSCGTDIPEELVVGDYGEAATYCFEFKNTGNTHLTAFKLQNMELSWKAESEAVLAPGKSMTLSTSAEIYKKLTNYVEVVATPSTKKGVSLGLEDVDANDPSGVDRELVDASVNIENTVVKVGDDGSASCGDSVEKVTDIQNTAVQYCLVVTNDGETALKDVVVTDEDIGFEKLIGEPLFPGETIELTVDGKILDSLKNKAYVQGTPIDDEGEVIPGLQDVTDCDPSEVEKLTFEADIGLTVTVYDGEYDGGAKCGTPEAKKYVEGPHGTTVTYCYEIENTGPTPLAPVGLNDMGVVFFKKMPTMKSGEKTMLSFDSKIEKPLHNVAKTIGDPQTEDGRDIPDLEDVSAEDFCDVGIIPLVPSVNIETTVYPGHDDGSSCSTATESVSGNFGDLVTYCLEVTNTGNTTLTSVYVFDNDIEFYQEVDNLSPGESTILPVERRIESDLTNVANVTAHPVLEDLSDIPGLEDVTDADDANVEVVAHSAAIVIENTVYHGHDGGESCGSDEASEIAVGYPDSPVTFCFKVTNSGNSHLGSVVVTNPVLGDFVDSTSIGQMAPGETKTISLPSTITSTTENDAIVVANPVLESGEDIPDADQVTSADPSEVELQEYAPEITLTNVVYLGTPDDNKCGTPAARKYAEAMYGTSATYCFNVTNMGDTTLTNINLTNPALEFSTTIDPLEPKKSVTITTSLPITDDVENMATVTAKPVTADHKDIPGLGVQTAEDDSRVEKLDFSGAIVVANTVVLGTDETQCGTDKALERQSGIYGTAVVYCISVTNAGETHLSEVSLVDEKLNYGPTDLGTLAPGETVSVTVAGEITDTLKNLATANGNPVTEDGTDIPDLENVEHSDASGVVRTELKASVKIDNKVMLGHDNGHGCDNGAAVEKVEGRWGDKVTYCFNMTNDGDCYLDNINVVDKEIKYVDNSIAYLAPGEWKMVPVEGVLSLDQVNFAVVTGNPCLEDGRDIPDLGEVTSMDPSRVLLLDHLPNIDIETYVYLGSDDGASCEETTTKYVENYNGAAVTYCFHVKNIGETHLADVLVTNEELNLEDDSIGLLGKDEVVIVAYTTTIDGPLQVDATATGIPALETGEVIPELEPVVDVDTASVGELEYYPGISIDNVVYLGSSDMGMSCSSGVEQVTGKYLTNVTYCFNVTNTGDTYLSDIVISNDDLTFTHSFDAEKLAPGASILVSEPANILASLNNTATVTANPILVSGVDISGAEDVTDSDPSEVVMEVVDGDVRTTDKPEYKPPEDPDQCMQDNWEGKGKDGELICATKEVYLESVVSDEAKTCVAGDKVTITVDALVKIAGTRKDFGYYIAVDGGDALRGTCSVNGFQQGNSYPVTSVDGTGAIVGSVAWDSNGGDGDDCGDIFTSGGQAGVDMPFAVDLEIPCVDENEDGHLDFAVCFTWRTDANDDVCDFSKNIPGDLTGGCFCTRYDVPNIPVEEPTPDIVPC